MRGDRLPEKSTSLAAERIAEVEDFVDSRAQRDDRRLVESCAELSGHAFESAWDNEEDAAYDQP
jgi:hypothetical protein